MFTKIKKILQRKQEGNENKTALARYYSMEEVTVTGFCNFCKNNIPLIITVSITLVFTYGIRLFWYSIDMDTESFMADKSNALRFFLSIGRFGQVLLSKLWYIKEFNPFTAFFTAFCLIWFFTISWCYIIAVFSRDTGRNNKLIPFALVFMTMPVWAEQFYFVFQAAENALIISLCQYVIYLLFKGILDNEKGKIICAFVLLVFITSVYQAIVPLFCCGVFVCFVLLSEHSEYEPQIYRNLCLKLFMTLLWSLIVYLFIARIVVPAVFHIEKSGYLDEMNLWGKLSVRDNIIRILSLGYTLTVGHIPLFQSIINPIIASYAGLHSRTGIEMIEFSANISRVHGNILLLPSALFFLIKMILVMRRTIPSGRRLLYMLAGIGIPLCIILLAVVGGTRPTIRTLYALPLAFAFMLFYLIRTYKKKAVAIVTCLSLFIALHQAEITAQLFYSDQMRYNEDVRLAYELNELITQVQPKNEKFPVVIAGRYQIASRFHTNFLQGETIGDSHFEIPILSPEHTAGRTGLVLVFMKTLGINFDMPDGNQIGRAIKEAASMPPYPDPGCVKRMQDYIVVRLSENLYEDE
jgi:hypothetical protein